MVLGKSGIQFPAETARPMVTAQGRADENGKITFDFPIPPPISKPYEDLVVGFSFRLTQGRRESLRVDSQAIRMEIFVDGKSTIARQLSVEPLLTIGADGWQSQLIASLNETTKRVRLEVSLPKAVASDSFTIETGSAYLMATLGDHAAHYWLGPYATQGNGKIVAANDGNTLTSRDTPRSVSNWKWTDTLNEFATIRAIDAAENSAVWGTRWGHVYLVDARGDVRQLNSLGQSHGGDVKEEVTSVAIDRRGNLAASGNLDGKVTLFDLTSTAANLNEVQIQAHSDAVSCVALNREGIILATAAENSKLKLWYIEGQESVLWCELTLGNPIKDMQFSPATAKLFILCRRERGIRVLDLEALKDEFEKLSINEPFLPSP